MVESAGVHFDFDCTMPILNAWLHSIAPCPYYTVTQVCLKNLFLFKSYSWIWTGSRLICFNIPGVLWEDLVTVGKTEAENLNAFSLCLCRPSDGIYTVRSVHWCQVKLQIRIWNWSRMGCFNVLIIDWMYIHIFMFRLSLSSSWSTETHVYITNNTVSGVIQPTNRSQIQNILILCLF